MAGHACAAAVLAFKHCGLAAVHGNAEGVTYVGLREGGRVDVV